MFDFWWKMNSARLNVKLKNQMNSEFHEFDIHRKLMKREIQWTKIKWFGIIIRDISYFKTQRFFGLKFGENEGH